MLGFNGGRLGSKNVIEQNGIVEPGDVNFDDVTLLLNGNGSNGSTNITDSSDSSQTITLSGNTQISTAQSKFGGSSIYFDGNGDFLQPPDDPNSFNFGTGNFTLECWIYPTGQGITGAGNLFSQRSNNNGITWRYIVASEEMQFFYGSGAGFFNSGTGSVPLNTWTHVALTRSGNTFTLWVGGQSGGTNTTTATMSYVRPRIGTSIQFFNEYYKGYIDDFRITKGVARYTASFTPPTAQFEPPIFGFKASGVWTIPEVSRLRRAFVWPGTNQANPIVSNGLVLNLDAGNTTSYPGSGTTWTDLSGNGNNGTLTNGPTYSSSNGGSIIFDGVNDYVQGTISSSTFTGPHSICCWFYRHTVKEWSALFSNNVNTNSCSILTFISTSNSLGTNQTGINATSIAVDLGADHLNKWIYGVITFGGASNGSAVNVYAYKDGSLLTNSGSLYWNLSSSSSYYVGRHWASGFQVHDGFISQVTIYNKVLTAAEITQNFNALKGRYGL